MDAKTFKKIQKVLDFTLNNSYSNFYKSKYEKAKVNLKEIEKPQDFIKIPYLKRKEIVETDPFKRIFIPLEKMDIVGITSGTTSSSSPLIILNTSDYPYHEISYAQKAYELNAKRWMLLYSVISGQYRLNREYFLKDKGIVRVLGDINNLSVSAKIASTLNIDTIQTTSTILSFFIPFLKEKYDLNKIKLIILGGEYTSEEKVKYFKNIFPMAFFKFSYGANESHSRGYRCDFLEEKYSPRYFHPVPAYYFETTGNNNEGELIMTHLHTSTAFPLIRYKTGDRVKITSEKCKCGNNTLMEVFGRLEQEVIRVGGVQIYAKEVEKAVKKIEKYLKTTDFRLHIFEEKYQGKLLPKLKLHLILKKEFKNHNLEKEIARVLSENVKVSSKFNLSQLVEKSVFFPLEIRFVQSFEAIAKAKRIILHIK